MYHLKLITLLVLSLSTICEDSSEETPTPKTAEFKCVQLHLSRVVTGNMEVDLRIGAQDCSITSA